MLGNEITEIESKKTLENLVELQNITHSDTQCKIENCF